MVHIATSMTIDPVRGVSQFDERMVPHAQSVLVVRDSDKNNEYFDMVCEFLDIGVEHASSTDDLEPLLRQSQPMAIIAAVEGEFADGFHVMKIAAGYDRSLPILLLTPNEPALLGAVDAMREVWGLRQVATASEDGIGEMVDFICHAARGAGRPRLMRI